MLSRTCGSCVKCCKGWLSATVRGHDMRPGLPCHYLQNGTCSDYENRPVEPCRTYTCAWLTDPQFPDWIKPSLVNVIISKTISENSNLVYYHVTEAGAQIDSTVLNWLMRWAISTGTNMIYSVGGQQYTLGSQEFVQFADLLKSGDKKAPDGA